MVDKPNVLLLILDTVRRDVVTPYTEERVTPCLSQLAEDGLLFENAVSTSDWTLPAHVSILTGQLTSRHGVNHNVGYGNLRGRGTLASMMRDAGYRTLGISCNPWFSSMTSLDEGFDEFRLLRPRDRRPLTPVNWFKDRVYTNFERAPPDWRKRLLLTYEWMVRSKVDDGCEEAFRGLLRCLDDGRSDRPWFAMVNVIEAHGHYVPPQPFRDRWVGKVPLGRLLGINQDGYNYHFGVVPMTAEDFSLLFRLYKAEVAYLDHMVGGLMRSLGRRGVLDDTLVVVTSDHGENFGEHGLMEHRWCVYDTLVHIPLLLRLPTAWRDRGEGVDLGRPVSLADLLPTLQPLAGFDVASGDGVQGIDLLSRGRELAVAEMVPRQLPRKRLPREAWERFEPIKVALRTRWEKLVWSSNGRHELYRLDEDPGETRDVFDPGAPRARELLAMLDRETDLESLARQSGAEEQTIESDELRARLRALGYVS